MLITNTYFTPPHLVSNPRLPRILILVDECFNFLTIKPHKLSLSILFPHSESSFSFLLSKNPKSLITPNNVFVNISGEKDFQEEEQEYWNNLRKQGWYSPRPFRAHTSRHLQRTRTLVLF